MSSLLSRFSQIYIFVAFLETKPPDFVPFPKINRPLRLRGLLRESRCIPNATRRVAMGPTVAFLTPPYLSSSTTIGKDLCRNDRFHSAGDTGQSTQKAP